MLYKSENIQIRNANRDDIKFILELEGDPENSLYIGQWDYKQHILALESEDIKYFIIQNDLSQKCGYAILTDLQNNNNSIHIKRIAIDPLKNNKGYGKKAFKLILDWIFENTQAHRVWLDVKDFNARAIHIYQSNGFVIEGTLRDCEFSNLKKEYESFYIMSILRREYEELKYEYPESVKK
ncbi:GNAT family N-acetyltransferase [Francisella sp. Scap27]|uniref:GNAT family N-acetyltransferase n=1 Tax=Francisella sp. Scap27 TaxID=2589986 RepID=UPI0015B9943E|nr:GNAT family protein [Francisella sp. Scap27]QLE78581.1 GNAT family N-acetyltransferase [Francisella sp. Scap27]